MPGDGFVLRVATHALAVKSDFHLAERGVIVHVLFYSNAVAPFPTADATDAVVRGAAVAVISDVIGEYVISGIGEVLVLDNEVYLDTVIVAPRLAKVPRETSTTHGQSMVEDDELIALATLGRDVPRFEGSTIIRWDEEIVPRSHPIFIGSLEDKATQWPHDVGNGFDLGVIFGGNALQLLLRFCHSFRGYSAHDFHLL